MPTERTNAQIKARLCAGCIRFLSGTRIQLVESLQCPEFLCVTFISLQVQFPPGQRRTVS